MKNPLNQQREPTPAELKAQIVRMLEQLGQPIPPKPDVAKFEMHGPDVVHEMIHLTQTQTLADNLQALVVALMQAKDALDEADVDAGLVKNIDNVMDAISVRSLTSSKVVLDLQEIEQELADKANPLDGPYL